MRYHPDLGGKLSALGGTAQTDRQAEACGSIATPDFRTPNVREVNIFFGILRGTGKWNAEIFASRKRGID